jgi:release factor glutamine methyltransferase
MTNDSLIIKDALDKSAEYLKSRGSASPRLDAEILLCRITGLARLQLYLRFDQPLSKNEIEKYRELLKRRAAHEPVAYIIGEKEFMSLPFYVSPAVLIPRPDTETLIEEAIKRIEEWRAAHPNIMPSLFEVGVGSGAIAVSLLHRFPEFLMKASDISAASLEVAQKNAVRHGVQERLSLFCASFFGNESGPFDFILSNPPYLSEKDKQTLAPDILLHEPHEALFAGEDGLDVLIPLIEKALKILSSDGWIFLEIAPSQFHILKNIVELQKDVKKVAAVEDYSGLVRVLSINKQ